MNKNHRKPEITLQYCTKICKADVREKSAGYSNLAEGRFFDQRGQGEESRRKHIHQMTKQL